MAWNDVDEHCPYCNSVTKINRGITKQNLKRLFFSKPTPQDLIMLTVMVLVMAIAWRYNIETAMCRDVIDNIESTCIQYCAGNKLMADLNQEVKEDYQGSIDIMKNFTLKNETSER